MKRLSHIGSLDGIRGIAVLLVMVCHFTAPFKAVTRSQTHFYNALEGGWVGVDLFFVLSGFLITGVLLNSKFEANYFRQFYLRRVLRIFPLYYLCLFSVFVFLPAVKTITEPSFVWLRGSQLWLWAYASNFLIAKTGGPLGYVNHFWSLAVEEQFYLFWPVVVFAFGRRGFRVACVTVIAIAIASRTFLYVRGTPLVVLGALNPCRLDTLALGSLLASYFAEEGGLRRLTRGLLPLGALSAFLFLMSFPLAAPLPWISEVRHVANRTVLGVLFTLLLAAILMAPPRHFLNRLLNSRIPRLFGKYCYGLYLLHPGVLFGVCLYFDPSWAQQSLGFYAGSLVFDAVLIALSLGVAAVSWHFFEKRFLALQVRPSAFTTAATPIPAPRSDSSLRPLPKTGT